MHRHQKGNFHQHINHTLSLITLPTNKTTTLSSTRIQHSSQKITTHNPLSHCYVLIVADGGLYRVGFFVFFFFSEENFFKGISLFSSFFQQWSYVLRKALTMYVCAELEEKNQDSVDVGACAHARCVTTRDSCMAYCRISYEEKSAHLHTDAVEIRSKKQCS